MRQKKPRKIPWHHDAHYPQGLEVHFDFCRHDGERCMAALWFHQPFETLAVVGNAFQQRHDFGQLRFGAGPATEVLADGVGQRLAMIQQGIV